MDLVKYLQTHHSLLYYFWHFSTVLECATRRQWLLEPAHHLYYAFWAKNPDELLQPVPGYPNLKYFTREQIEPLKRCLYGEDILLVREEYKDVYNALWRYKKAPRRGGVVIAGQPGIGKHTYCKHVSLVVSFANAAPDLGKTCFLYYVLLRLLCEQQPVALQVNKDLLFSKILVFP